MKPIRPLCLSLWVSSALGLGACSMAPASVPAAAPVSIVTAMLLGASEAPAVMTVATGTLDATLAPASRVLTWKLSYTGLSGPATAAHFHGPAVAGQNAEVVVPIYGPLTSPVSGKVVLSPSQVAEVTAGQWYVNVHTAAHPTGEIRGQVAVRP